jgi:hypothetical protein
MTAMGIALRDHAESVFVASGAAAVVVSCIAPNQRMAGETTSSDAHLRSVIIIALAFGLPMTWRSAIALPCQ